MCARRALSFAGAGRGVKVIAWANGPGAEVGTEGEGRRRLGWTGPARCDSSMEPDSGFFEVGRRQVDTGPPGWRKSINPKCTNCARFP